MVKHLSDIGTNEKVMDIHLSLLVRNMLYKSQDPVGYQ